jgi:hypothetical protein
MEKLVNFDLNLNQLYYKKAVDALIERLNKLQPSSVCLWGNMNVPEMLSHVNAFLEFSLNKRFHKRLFMGRIMGRFLKKGYLSDEQFPKNSPTLKEYIFKENLDFEKERIKTIELLQEFHLLGPEHCTQQAHPFFGKLTPSEWAKAQWKHMDHHLRQFGV